MIELIDFNEIISVNLYSSLNFVLFLIFKSLNKIDSYLKVISSDSNIQMIN